MAQRFLLNKLSLALKTALVHWEQEGFDDAVQGKINARDRVPAMFRKIYQRGWKRGCEGKEDSKQHS